ncbi:hypothetical protein HRI_002750400 [Hibiscus trionum]|uniref:Uncharacterized protein n=1 Tax=Hibiscus trionum TaxID=183268 RepID=A0A9W7I8I3_HIBTR|nr:hypothetical protein HRI_002750400 [Hibiscus trionum]
MGHRMLRVLVLWLFIFLLSEAAVQGSTSASRYSHMFHMNPKSSHRNSPRSFFGALPKTIPIPPSAPSRNHNDIGLQSSKPFP